MGASNILTEVELSRLFQDSLESLHSISGLEENIVFFQNSKLDRLTIGTRLRRDNYEFASAECVSHKDRIPTLGNIIWYKLEKKDVVELWLVIRAFLGERQENDSIYQKFFRMIKITEFPSDNWREYWKISKGDNN